MTRDHYHFTGRWCRAALLVLLLAGRAGAVTGGTRETLSALQLSTSRFVEMTSTRPPLTESRRIAFRAPEFLAYFLRDDPEIVVDNVLESSFTESLQALPRYDVLVLNDVRPDLLKPHLDAIAAYVEMGGGLLVLGGYAAFGGRGRTFGDYRCLDRMLPVSITATPDWVDQTPYPEGRREERGRGGHTTLECRICGRETAYYDGFLPVVSDLSWVGQGTRLRPTAAGRDMLAGLPVESLAPGFHRVVAKGAATTMAQIGDDPAIVAQPRGRGRVVAVMISDYRRMYFWRHSRELYRRLLMRAAGGTADPRPAQATVRRARARREGDVRLDISPGHRHSFRRGEEVAPPILIDAPERVAELVTTLREASGRVVAAGRCTTTGAVRTASIPTEDLAYGAYEYVAQAYDGRHGLVGQASADIDICAEPDVHFPVFYYGQLGDGNGTYTALAGIEYLLESVNVIFGPKLRPGVHYQPVVDAAFRLGAKHILWANNAALRGPSFEGALCQRHPLKLAWTRDYLRAQFAGFEHLPAVLGAYLDDEGYSRSFTTFDQEQFKRQYGFAMPDYRPNPKKARLAYREEHGVEMPEPPLIALRERLSLAEYHLESMDMLLGVNAEETKRANPQWRAYALKAIKGRGRITGIDPEQGFDGMDALMVDIYPKGLSDIGRDFLYFNLMRCAANRARKPAYVMLQCVYGDEYTARMQYWLMLGSGLEGMGWYNWKSFYTGRYEALKPLNHFAVDYAALLARWDKPRSRIAVLYSDAMMSRTSVKAFQAALHEFAEDLYRRDLYPDFVREASLQDGTVSAYDALALIAIEELSPSALEALKLYAREGSLYLDDRMRVSIPGSRKLDADEIRRRFIPPVVTEDENVFAEPLDAGGMRYVLLYNHNTRQTAAAVELNEAAAVRSIYELTSCRPVRFRRDGAAIAFTDTLGAIDGRIYALFEKEPRHLSIASPGEGDELPAGSVLALDITATPAQRGHVPVAIEVTRPDGRRSAYSRRTVLENGALRFSIPFAVNDPPGAWTITARDTVAGLTATRSFGLTATPGQ